ncbi:MAG: hypothetical protein KDD47_14535 [Acidobacteria bacterium]|nr:hypothetical protein [Acidobacteriota bacterium]
MLNNVYATSITRTGCPPKIERFSLRQCGQLEHPDRRAHERIRERSFTCLRVALLAVVAAVLFLLTADGALASPCGGRGQRACCILDSHPGCQSGLSEYPGCSGDCGCGYFGWSSSGTCWSPSACGGNGQRACCLGESGRACRPGTVEAPGCAFGNECQCGSSAWGIHSSGTFRAVTQCGGEGQRACCAGEASQACGVGLTEKPGCSGSGCQCGNLPWGVHSSGTCVRVTPCGGEGQRACCVTEAGSACGSGLIEAPGCDLSGDGCQCEDAPWGVRSSGTCQAATPCGDAHQRACCLTERVPSCDAGMVEVLGCDFGDGCQCGSAPWGIQSSGTCRPLTPYRADTWMEDIFSKNPEVRLRDVLIPESHDAGSYGITIDSAWDSVNVDYSLALTGARAGVCVASPLSKYCWNFEHEVGDIVKSWAVTQYTNLYGQLTAGARSIDLRSTSWNGEIRLAHNMVVAEATLQAALDDIARFAQEHPKEIIFIDFRPPEGLESTAADMILNTLGSHIADVRAFSPATLTVQDVWDSGGSIVLLPRYGFESRVPGAVSRGSWTAGDLYANSTVPATIKAYVDGQLESADDELEVLLQLSLSTTAGEEVMARAEIEDALLNWLTAGLVNPDPSIHQKDGAVRHLRDDWLREWVQDPEKSRAANIFGIDFVPQASEFIDDVISQNQARFFRFEASTEMDEVVTGDLLAGAANSQGATVVIDSTQTLGAVTDYGDGTFQYDPNGQFSLLSRGETATDSFRFQVTYAAGNIAVGTATITVLGPPYIDSLNYSDFSGMDFYFVSDSGLCADAVGNNDQSSGPASVMYLRDCDSVFPEFFRWMSDGRIRPAWTSRYLMTHSSGQIRHYAGSGAVWEYTADRRIRTVSDGRCMTYGAEGETVTWATCDSPNVGRWKLIRKPDDSGTEGIPFYFATDEGLCADSVGDNDQYSGPDSIMYLQDCATVDQEYFLWTAAGLIQTSWTTRTLLHHASGQLRHYAGGSTVWEFTLNGKVRTETNGVPYCIDYGAPGEYISVVSCDAPDVGSWKLLKADGTELMVRGAELVPTDASP